ncbi:hypothetical protein [Streptomyces sp. NBC_00566]|uniref:hypothetical protein n=1 Tax=Streptomyces sp. NBC_00566 TaxID=2975778 RepID=UPI002E81DE8A|nr:hypothetical protein [Streptomyces sp. NBC_00566]WUB87007.1 hypothetical protein OG812_10560 [Streptomyces sp. NBC_00566]
MSTRLISLYAAVLGALSIATAVPVDAVSHPALTMWSLAAMPSSVLMTVAWMAVFPTAFEPGPTLAALLTLTLHLAASALNVAGLVGLRKACTKCRVLSARAFRT